MDARRPRTVMLLVPAMAMAIVAAVALVLLSPPAPPLSPSVPPELQTPAAATTDVPPFASARTTVEPVASEAPPHTGAIDVAALLEAGGPAATTASLRRAAARPDTPVVQLFVAVVREPRCSAAAIAGDTPAEFAMQQLLLASRTDAAARAGLGELAFEALPVPAIHRARAARAFAGSATEHEAQWLRARAESTGDPLLREAILSGLGDDGGR